MEWVSLIISLVSGAAGGNIAGALQKDKNFGPLVNSVIGLIGGGVGRYILQALGLLGATAFTQAAPDAAPSVDWGQLLGNVGGSGAGGLLLTLLASYLKNKT
jgi:uncharacterized membrane protein YeaQ/YmgE (transglycosylase-associated protein family)